MSASTKGSDMMSVRKYWLFSITAFIIVPALCIALLEVGLRIFGFGYPAEFTANCEVTGRDAYCENNKFPWLFFPPEIARGPLSFVIPAVKSDKTYRIFILGASAALGDPEPTYSFGRILEVMLQNRYPDVNFEIINTAIVAINSHVVLKISKDLQRHRGDLFIVYLGNNEVVGPFGAGTVLTPVSSSLSAIRAGIKVKTTRVGQLLLKSMNLITRDGKETTGEWLGMEMFLDKQVRAADPALQVVYDNYKKNLEDIINIARNSDTKVIVSTVGVNLKDSAPFASLHRKDMTEEEKKAWESLYSSGIALETAGKYTEAIQQYLEASGIDESFADLQYRIGRSYWMLGNYEKSRSRCIRTRDFDTLRFRADTKINNIIRSIADGMSSEGIYLVDTMQTFEDNSLHETPGAEMFHDHVHMNFRGNFILAENMFRQIEKILPERMQQSKSNRPILTEVESAGRLVLTSFDRHKVAQEMFTRIGRPPFTNQLNHEEQVKLMQQNLDRLSIYTYPDALQEAATQYYMAIQNARPDPWLNYKYAVLLEDNRNYRGAEEQLRIFLRQIPQHLKAHEKLASALIQQRKFNEAIAHCRETVKINPEFTILKYNIAFALSKLGRFDESLDIYKNLLLADPKLSMKINNAMGQILVKQKKFDEAAVAFQKTVQLNAISDKKNIADIHYNLGYVLTRLGRLEEATKSLNNAIEEYREELDKYPQSSAIHLGLGSALFENGDLKQAAVHFQQAVDLDPAYYTNHINLIKVLKSQGRLDAAIDAFKKAINFMSLSGQNQAALKLRDYLKSFEAQKSKHN